MDAGQEKRLHGQLDGSTVLITGGTGSLGKALTELLCKKFILKRLIIFSRDEFKQSEMAKVVDCSSVRFFIGDIRDLQRLNEVVDGADYIIHTAALKQVPAMEYNPSEAIKTNVLGADNVIHAAIAHNIKTVVNISTDKAVNPINLYGATKLCAEKLFSAANAYNKTRFVSVRYGNVIGSRGSIIPFLRDLKTQGKTEVPLTHPDMTRFWITLEQAVNLIQFAITDDRRGVIYVPKIPAKKITDLAKEIIPDCRFKIIGVRPGEKIHEILVDENETNVIMVDMLSEKETEIIRPYRSNLCLSPA